MDAVKPLIFVHPLSPTLQKLKEVSEENAEADGVEIYEIDDMMEFNQLFPTVGQSVCVFSDPKKCAKALQSNKKTMKSIHSKVILVSPKKIPPKTLEKFDKVGLTECIMEPVVPKTLMYKVKLQLRSIKAQSMDDEEEAEKTFSRNDANKKEDDDSYYKSKKDKKEQEDEESIDYRQKHKKNDEEQDEDSQKGSYHDHQESHWKGKVHKDDLNEDENSEKKDKYKEEAIDTHYKGKSKNSQLDFDEDLYEKEKKEANLDEDDELDDIKKSIALEIEQETNSFGKEYDESDEEADERQKDHKLDLDIQKEEKKKESDPNHMESHMKGKLGKTEEEEENQAHDSERDHLTDNKMKGRAGAQSPDEDDLAGEKNKDVGLGLEEDEEKDPRQGHKSESYDGKMKHDGEAIHEESGPLIDEQGRKSKNIEKYIKGSLSHREDEDEEDDELIDNEITLDKPPTSKEKDPQIGEDCEDDESLRSKGHQLDLESDEQEDPNKEEQGKSEDSQRKPKKSQDPEVEAERQSKAGKNEETEDPFSASSSSGRLTDEDPKNTERQKNKEESKESKTRDDLSGEKNQKPHEPQRADNRADQIKKHYKGKGNRHEEQGWGNLHKRQESHDDDFGGRKKTAHGDEDYGSFKRDEDSQAQNVDNAKKEGPSYSIDQDEAKNAGELHYAQDELGEQTIDYGKLKDEFDAIPYDLKDKKKIWTEYEGKDNSQRNVDITDSQSSPLSDIDPSDSEKEVDEGLQTEEQEKSEDGETVYEPFSCGLEEVIKVQSFYHKKEMPFKDFLNHLAHTVYEQHSGLVTFYSYKKGTQGPELALCPFKNILPSDTGGETHEKWEELKEIKLPFWKQMKLPAWSDHTFQDKELDFYYPYFESGEFMGFAVVYFTKGFKESKKGSLEVLLESARGFYSENHSGQSAKRHENSITQVDINKVEEKDPRKTGGFFSKFFGKKAS